jgi:hypothetical protein
MDAYYGYLLLSVWVVHYGEFYAGVPGRCPRDTQKRLAATTNLVRDNPWLGRGRANQVR